MRPTAPTCKIFDGERNSTFLNFRKSGQPARCTEILGNAISNFRPKFDFPPIFWIVRILEIQKLLNSLEIFSGNFLAICTRFDIFGIGWMENAPRLSKVCEIQNWNFHEYKIWAISQKILLSKCNRLQNSRTSTFCERERRGQYSNGRPGASEETATRGSS